MAKAQIITNDTQSVPLKTISGEGGMFVYGGRLFIRIYEHESIVDQIVSEEDAPVIPAVSLNSGRIQTFDRDERVYDPALVDIKVQY